MNERDSFSQEFFNGRDAIELHPGNTQLWYEYRIVNLDDCNRMVIEGGTLEFHCDRNIVTLCLDEAPFFINHQVNLLDIPAHCN